MMDRQTARDVLQELIVPLWVRVCVHPASLGSLRLRQVPTIAQHALLAITQIRGLPQSASLVRLANTPKICSLTNVKIVTSGGLLQLLHCLQTAQFALPENTHLPLHRLVAFLVE